jgi:hypothetical protein
MLLHCREFEFNTKGGGMKSSHTGFLAVLAHGLQSGQNMTPDHFADGVAQMSARRYRKKI